MTRFPGYALISLLLTGAISACQPTATPLPLSPTSAAVMASPTVDAGSNASTQMSALLPPLKPSPDTPTAQPPTATPARTSGGGGQPKPPAGATATPGSVVQLQPCHNPGELEIYLVVNQQLRHIADWDTFVNLGYTQADIVDCGASSTLPRGGPVTRLVKGSGDPVYWMDGGKRRHIPDMATFTALGYKVEDITSLPDSVIGAWPLGQPLAAASASGPGTPADDGAPVKEVQLGAYLVRIFHQTTGVGGPYYGVIVRDGQPDIVIWDVESLGDLPAADVTGEGDPDVEFLTRTAGSTHCCWGTVVYNLGQTAVKVLDIISTPDYGDATGRGVFKDLNNDGSYEFLTHDAMSGIPCSQPAVSAVLGHSSSGSYEGAGPRYPYAFSDELDQLKARTQPGGICDIYPYIATLYTTGAIPLTQAKFDRLYNGPDSSGDWARLAKAVEGTRFYVPRIVTAPPS